MAMETRCVEPSYGLAGEPENEMESDAEAEDDPERLLNEWLGELNTLTGGLDSVSPHSMRPPTSHLDTPRIDSYRFSMANLEDSQETELDAILGELCALESQCEQALTGRLKAPGTGDVTTSRTVSHRPTHSRSSSEGNRAKMDPDDSRDHVGKPDTMARTESPDNDSAFSDNVSMLSSESSASSGGSGGGRGALAGQTQQQQLGSPTTAGVQADTASRAKAEKIRIALEKMREASVKKLFIKAFGCDGSSKSLLVDEAMTAGHVARLLADKNHVAMEPRLALVEQLPDLHMERAYEDHEALVENLLMWTRDSRNKLLFVERPEKVALFQVPEMFLLPPAQRGAQDYDDHARSVLIEEFFSGGAVVPEVEGPLFLKSESKKGWKRHHFVLRPSGLYYLPKEKGRGTASARDLLHLASFDVNQVYYGVGWRKKYKAPTDFCFAIKHPRLQQPKSSKFVKFLCAEDEAALHRWVTGIRLAKFGRRLLEDYRSLVDELAQEDLEQLAAARSWSVGCIAPAAASPSTPSCDAVSTSSSSSSGCLSDTGCCDGSSAPSGNSSAGFECDFPTGTIKRKPSVNPKLPLTSITRQLKEVGEGAARSPSPALSPQTTPTELDGTATLVHRTGSVRRRRPSCQTPSTPDSGSGSNSSTLKRQHGARPTSSASSGASTPMREPPPQAQPPPPAEFEQETELPPPPDDMLCSTLSLDSLPPPPPPSNPGQLSGSQLSLASLPPPPPPYRPPPPPPTPPSGASTPTGCLSPVPPPTPPPVYSAPPYLAELKAASSPSLSRRAPHSPSTQQRSRTTGKKISFAIPDDVSADGTRSLPPPPPRRSESTRLSTPRPAPQQLPPPPKDFLKDLQRVMKKKWQVAQKCKADLTTTPHEVLGFRDAPPPPPPLPPSECGGGREDSVRDWVREHYGGQYSLYENVHLVNGKAGHCRQQPGPAVSAPPVQRLSRQNSVAAAIAAKKRPPPPPPKRAETTQLSTVPPPVHRR